MTTRFPFRPGAVDAVTLTRRIDAAMLEVEPTVLATATHFGRGPEDAEELAQVIRIKIWKRLFAFDATRATLSAFAHAVAANAAKDELRTRARAAKRSTTLDVVELQADNRQCDRQVEQLAENVIADPSRYFPPSQAQAVAAKQDPAAGQMSNARQLAYTTHAARKTVRRLAETILI